ncbi:DnaJ-class molecular chaperone with C-terminal Zn finger domain [Xenococcus sp. PCC 7305]|uniref:J domain-containing protein n=1 Tax=Xenococcus sp. PCC 7305 TaxID=102125 RepID=UPI0002AD0022|nr:DnaJ domain-containing protein [Xenococcus sp. PCC 7305]ELS04122.1 DnaJ-class molecular chaperone with C-terminal Zn finger domain [Xenococcus sp. PCC 7305]
MAFAIKHGLFRLNITDYHAILGVSLDDNPKNIRLKYLRIAQQLHPDTCKGDQVRKELANSILSKLVNPAYEQLSRKNCFAEHQLVLTQIGKRLAEKSDRMTVASKQAKDLLESAHKLEIVYNEHLKKLVTNQYQDLEKVTDKIAVISELNLVYLMIKQGRGINRAEDNPVKAPAKQEQPSPTQQRTSNKASSVQPPKPPEVPKAAAENKPVEENTPQVRVSSFIRRAKEYIEKESYSQAIAELRDGLKIDPNNSTCHGLMGKIYLLQNQITMAKVHIGKAHKANPKDPIVIEVRKELNKLTKTKTEEKKGKNGKANAAKSETKGLFSGLFGAKKK